RGDDEPLCGAAGRGSAQAQQRAIPGRCTEPGGLEASRLLLQPVLSPGVHRLLRQLRSGCASYRTDAGPVTPVTTMSSRHWSEHEAAVEVQLPVALGAASTSTAAGHSERIPPIFLVAFDLVTLGLAFATTRPLAPYVQSFLLSSGPIGFAAPWLALPEGGTP